MAEDYELDLSGGEFAALLGFEKKILKDSKTFIGDTVLHIARGVYSICIHSDLITRQTSDVANNVLYCLSPVGLDVGCPFKEAPERLEYHTVNKSRIDPVGIRIIDVVNKIIHPNGLISL